MATKLDIEVEEMRAIMDAPNKKYSDYKNKMWLISLGAKVQKLLGEEKGNLR
jgi:hypothetical protein